MINPELILPMVEALSKDQLEEWIELLDEDSNDLDDILNDFGIAMDNRLAQIKREEKKNDRQ